MCGHVTLNWLPEEGRERRGSPGRFLSCPPARTERASPALGGAGCWESASWRGPWVTEGFPEGAGDSKDASCCVCRGQALRL